MAGFKRTVYIDRPVGDVFDFATDLKNAPRLMPTVTRAELVTDGGMRPGAKFRETRLMKGKERSAVIEVIEHRRPDVHAASAAMMGMKATYWFRFTPEGTGTRVELDADVRGNWLWKPFLGMMTRVMEKEDGGFLDRLKAEFENSNGN
jgi:hypothetical protein